MQLLKMTEYSICLQGTVTPFAVKELLISMENYPVSQINAHVLSNTHKLSIEANYEWQNLLVIFMFIVLMRMWTCLQWTHINSAVRNKNSAIKEVNSMFLTNQCLPPPWQVSRHFKMFLSSSHP